MNELAATTTTNTAQRHEICGFVARFVVTVVIVVIVNIITSFTCAVAVNCAICNKAQKSQQRKIIVKIRLRATSCSNKLNTGTKYNVISQIATTSNANKPLRGWQKWARVHLHDAADALHACGKQREMQ